MEKTKKILVLEAFSGIGTQRMALNRLDIDFEVVAVSEIDENAIKSYEAIHGETKNLGDISKIDAVPKHHLFTYTFPCQDISLDGKQKGFSADSDTRSSLLWDAMDVVELSKPKFLFAENVTNILSKKFKEDFDKWIEYLDKLGYNTYYKKIKSIDFGIPQNRERAFIVSIRKDVDDKSFEFPKPITLQKSLLDMLEDNADEKYYVKDNVMNQMIYRGDDETVVDGKLKIRNATLTGYILAKHGDGIDVSYPSSKTRRGRVQDNRIQTLTTKHTYTGVLLCDSDNPTEESFRIRHLTPLEYWRLMGISDEDFAKAKSVSKYEKDLYKQAGNAIVVDVLEHIFKKIVDMHNK